MTEVELIVHYKLTKVETLSKSHKLTEILRRFNNTELALQLTKQMIPRH